MWLLVQCARHVCVGGFYGRGVPPIAVWISPAEPGFVAFGAIVGGLFGHFVLTRFSYDEDNKMQIAVDGSYCGAGIALAVYVLVNLVETSLG